MSIVEFITCAFKKTSESSLTGGGSIKNTDNNDCNDRTNKINWITY